MPERRLVRGATSRSASSAHRFCPALRSATARSRWCSAILSWPERSRERASIVRTICPIPLSPSVHRHEKFIDKACLSAPQKNGSFTFFTHAEWMSHWGRGTSAILKSVAKQLHRASKEQTLSKIEAGTSSARSQPLSSLTSTSSTSIRALRPKRPPNEIEE